MLGLPQTIHATITIQPDSTALVEPAPVPQPAPPEILTVEQTAELLSVDPTFVRLLIKEGTIPAIHLGQRTIRIPRALLMQRLLEMAQPS